MSSQPNVAVPEDLHTHACHTAMWHSVESDDIMAVRKLINQWCRVDIEKGGLTLRDLALSRGCDRIISLVLRMDATLRFVHAVVDNRQDELRLLLDTRAAEIDVNFPNMKFMGVTAIFFAIRHGNCGLVQLLLQHGAKVNVALTLPDQSELPLLFHVLAWALPQDLLSLLVSRAASQGFLDKLNYKGSSILHWAVGARVPIERIFLLLRHSTPPLLCCRNQKNLTFLDLAESPLGARIAQHLLSCYQPSDATRLLECIVSGFDYVWDIFPEPELEPPLLDCARQLERHVYQFVCAVEYADCEAVQELTYFQHGETQSRICVANCRNIADGQPPLHKAVLNQDAGVVRHLCEMLVHCMGVKLDSVRDTFGRTALCYAYAFADADHDVVNLLLDNGSSEFAADYADKTPLSFREARHHQLMESFLEFHRSGGYRQQQRREPPVWSGGPRPGAAAFCRRCCTRPPPAGAQDDRSDCDSCDSSADLDASSSYTCCAL